MRYTIKRIGIRLKNVFSFPIFWITLGIIILSVVALITAIVLHQRQEEFVSSIFLDAFIGLITGLVLAVLSGIKSAYCAYKEARLQWLDKTHRMILDFLNEEQKLWTSKDKTDEEFFNIVYDAGAKANWVNDRIMQGTFDKVKWFDPPRYFQKQYRYDCLQVADVLSELRDHVIENGEDHSMRNDVTKEIRKVSNIMSTLNHDVLADIDSIKIKLAEAKKALI